MKRTKAHAETPPPADSSPSAADGTAAGEALASAPASPLTAEQLAELQARAAKADEHWERLLRTAADFDNFKKRAAREKQEGIQFANEGLLNKLLPVLDSLDKAVTAAQSATPEANEALHEGVNMISRQLKSVLAEAGLEEVDAMGQLFDPHLHEAISQLETPEVPPDHVAQQLRKGYRLRGRLLRPATVVVAKSPAA